MPGPAGIVAATAPCNAGRVAGAILALLLAGRADAASPDALAARQAVGGTLVELAAQPAIAGLVRGVARGHQQAVYAGLRLPGPPVSLHDGRWLVGWGCGDTTADGCTGRGLFLAFDVEGGRLFLMLLEDGAAVYLAPPRTGHWPTALAGPFFGFAPGLARPPAFDQG